MTVIEVNDNDFDEKVIEKSKDTPVLVDFWAGWCMPCKSLSPVLDEIAEDFEGDLILAKVNVDNAPTKSREYGVRSIPNVKLFKDGEVTNEFVGAKPKQAVASWLEGKLD